MLKINTNRYAFNLLSKISILEHFFIYKGNWFHVWVEAYEKDRWPYVLPLVLG